MSIPPTVLEYAAVRRLGEPVQVFDARIGLRRALAWIVLLALAGVVLLPAALLYLAAGRLWLGVLATALTVAYWGGSVGIMWRGGLRGRGRTVYLFKDGLVLTDSGRIIAHAWDDLVSVTVAGTRRAAKGRTRWRFTVTAAGGHEIRLGDELPDVRELGEIVVAEVTGRVVPCLLGVIETGDAVRLTPFTVGPGGVEKEGEWAPWPAVRDVGINNGMVYVRTHDDLTGLVAVAALMPNALAFVELCRRIMALREDGHVHGDDHVQ